LASKALTSRVFQAIRRGVSRTGTGHRARKASVRANLAKELTMSLKLKALGLAVFAALAAGAVSVVSAGADTGGVMHSDVEWTHITGKQEGSLHSNVLVDHLLKNSVTCKTANYTASVGKKTATEVTVIPEYKECSTTDPVYPATVNMNGCHFTLTFTDLPEAKHHTAHLECPAGKEVKVSVNPPIVGECHIYIPPQTPTTGGVAYTNKKHPNPETSPHAITLDITVEGITVTREPTGFGCPEGHTHDNKNTLKGTVIATGFETAPGSKQVNITVTTAKE
jgi:hypothetical protein